MEHLTVNLQELFEEIKERAFADGAFTRQEWSDIVDEIIEEKREVQELHDDVDLSEMSEALKARYEEFEAEIPTA